MAEPFRYAFLAKGKLYVADSEAAPRAIESTFVDQYKSRVRKMQRRNAWKQQGAGARFMGGGGVLWGDNVELDAVPVSFTGVARGASADELLYTVSTGVVGGVFSLDLRSGEEKRIFHSADRRIEQIATSPEHAVVACTLRAKGGTSAIAVMSADGSEVFEVTDGDVVDLAPRWLPEEAITLEGRRHQIVFQSAGVGRNEAGEFAAIGPASVAMLDAEHGELQVLREDPKREFLSPSMGADRTLYCIRRTYTDATEPRPLGFLLDVLFFPLRLFAAVLGWLSFFTIRYTGKPLFTSGSARQRSSDMRQMMMMGNLMGAREDAERDAERAARDATRDWQLVAVRPDGTEEILTKGVRAYDLSGDGRIVLTDGHRVEVMDKDGNRALLTKQAGVTEVIAL